MNTFKLSSSDLEEKTNNLYRRIDDLRDRHGIDVEIALGHRDVYAHHVTLNITEEAIELARSMYPDLDEEFPIESVDNHHPFLIHLWKCTNRPTKTIKLLPGECYQVYSAGDDNVVVIVRGHLPRFTPLTDTQKTIIENYTRKASPNFFEKHVSDMKAELNRINSLQ